MQNILLPISKIITRNIYKYSHGISTSDQKFMINKPEMKEEKKIFQKIRLLLLTEIHDFFKGDEKRKN